MRTSSESILEVESRRPTNELNAQGQGSGGGEGGRGIREHVSHSALTTV